MRIRTLAWVLSGVLLSACTARVTRPAVEIEATGPVTVEVGKRGGGFCPPGQRKHGNC